MTTWNYTKKITMDNLSLEGRLTHEEEVGYVDWYFSQAEAGLADSTLSFTPVYLASDSVYEVLVTNQTQADSYIAMAYAIGEKIGYPLNATVVDVNYTTDTLPDNFR